MDKQNNLVDGLKECNEVATKIYRNLLELLDGTKEEESITADCAAVEKAMILQSDLQKRLSDTDKLVARLLAVFGVN